MIFAITSVLSNVLLNILNLHECKVAIYILTANETRTDDVFIDQVSLISNIPFWIQETNIDLSYETCPIGKACLMSISEETLGNVTFGQPCKRPMKILLGSLDTTENPKPDYEPLIVEYPPVISIFNTALSPSKYISTLHVG